MTEYKVLRRMTTIAGITAPLVIAFAAYQYAGQEAPTPVAAEQPAVTAPAAEPKKLAA